jgi:hypothetical protein
MSSKLPVTSAKNLEKILLLMGFEAAKGKPCFLSSS